MPRSPDESRSNLRFWRHIKVILVLAPTWLFVLPGGILVVSGFVLMVAQLLAGPRSPLIVGSIHMDFHWSIVGGFLVLIGYQLLAFYLSTNLFLLTEGRGGDDFVVQLLRLFTLERVIRWAWLLLIGGMALDIAVTFRWITSGFGPLVRRDTRIFVLGSTLIVLGIQQMLNAFFFSVLRDAYTLNRVGPEMT
ncbi:MAG: hypothetical protein NVSMB57_07020 [Actinomycetota bacterium]